MIGQIKLALGLDPRTPCRRSPHWRALRRLHLGLEPVCQACGSDKDLNVHHILPYDVYPIYELAPG